MATTLPGYGQTSLAMLLDAADDFSRWPTSCTYIEHATIQTQY